MGVILNPLNFKSKSQREKVMEWFFHQTGQKLKYLDMELDFVIKGQKLPSVSGQSGVFFPPKPIVLFPAP